MSYLWYFTIIWIKIWLITYNSWPHQGVFEVLQIFGVKKPISWAPIDLDIQIYIIYTIMSAFCSSCQFIRIPVNLEFCQVFRCIPCVFMCSFLIDQLGNVPLINSNKVYDKAVAWVGSLKARRLSIPGKMPSLNVAVFSLFDFLASTLLAP